MRKTQQTFQLSLVSVALLGAFAPVWADEAEIASLTKPESWISVGIGNWSNDRHQLGIYDGMRDAGVYGLIDADIVKRDDATGTWYTFSGRNLGLDTRELKAEFLRQGDIGGFVAYSRTPRDNPNTFNTGLRGIGSTKLTISGAGVNALPKSEVTLGTERDLTHLGFYKNLMPGVELNVSFKNEDKNGTRHWGRGGAPEFAVEPIDSTTRQLEATVSYTGERLQLSGGYYGSWYDNANGFVDTIRQGQLATTVGNHFFLSLPLDNQAHQLFIDGGYTFTPTTRGTFKVSYSHATQNEHLPTKDIDATFPGFSLTKSPDHLNGELNTTLVQLGLTSRPIKDLSLVANLRYHDLKDDTPVARFVQPAAVTNDRQCGPAPGLGQCVDNTPFSFKTVTSKLEGTYRLPMGFSLTGGAEYRTQDRTVPVSDANGPGGTDTQRVVPARTKVDESTYRIEARRAMSDTVNGSLAYLHSERDGSSYISAAAGPGGTASDLINPIHIADRDRNKWRLAVDWTPVEKLSLQFAYENARDEYTHDAVRKYGLLDGDATLYSLDGSYSLNDNWQVTAWYSRDNTHANQLNGRFQQGTTPSVREADKFARLSDVGDSVGLGLNGKVSSRVRVGADLHWARTRSEYPVDVTLTGLGTTKTVFPTDAATGATAAALPSIENKATKISFFAEYALQKNSDVRVDFVHERWQTNDWTWQFADGSPFTYTGAGANAATFTDGTTVTANQKQVSNFVGLRYSYKFQ